MIYEIKLFKAGEDGMADDLRSRWQIAKGK